MSRRVAALAVHAYTASGGVVALAALRAAVDRDIRAAFGWLIMAYVIDATDGVMARTLRVREVLPEVDGDRLDGLVDFLTFAIVPLAILWRADLLPQPVALWASLIMLAALLDFSKDHPHKGRGIYTGLIAVWNAYAFYAWVLYPSPAWQVGVIVVMLVLTVVPLPFVAISQAPIWRQQNVLGVALWVGTIALYVSGIVDERVVRWSLIFPVLYLAEAIWLRLKFGPAAQGLVA